MQLFGAAGLKALAGLRQNAGNARDTYVRDKFTREHGEARRVVREYFAKYPKDRFQTEVESWRHLQSKNDEFTMKRLREPVGPA
jgi:hypothetical protein